MAYNPINDDTHVRYYCSVHKKHIFFFKKDIAFRGFHCWDCNYESDKEENKKKGKKK